MFVAAGIDLRMRWDSAGSLVQRCWRVFGVAGANFSRCEPEVGSHGRRQAARCAAARAGNGACGVKDEKAGGQEEQGDSY